MNDVTALLAGAWVQAEALLDHSRSRPGCAVVAFRRAALRQQCPL